MSTNTSYLRYQSTLVMNSIQFYFQKCLSIMLPVEKVVFLNDSPYLAIIEKLSNIYFVSEWGCFVIKSMLKSCKESTLSSFATKCYKIRSLSIMEIPVLMSPVLSSWANSSLSLIYDEIYTVILCQFSEFFKETWCCHLISNTANWFNENCTTFSPWSSRLNNSGNFF